MKKKNLKRECYYIAHNIYSKLQMVKCTTQFKIQVCYHFFHWLRKEHILLEYIENYYHHFTDSYYHIEDINQIVFLVHRAFAWSGTKQGYNFWVNVSIKWFNYVVNHNDLLVKMYGTKKIENETQRYNTTRH